MKFMSSLQKCFLDDDIDQKTELQNGSCLKGESYAFSVIYCDEDLCWNRYVTLKIRSEISQYITVSRVCHVPVHMPVVRGLDDDNYLRKTPGLYPDLLIPIKNGDRLPMTYNTESLLVEVNTEHELAAGNYDIKLGFCDAEGNTLCEKVFDLEVIDAVLPEQELIFSQWFYCDCLQDFYGTESFSPRHWQIIESFLRTAAKRGVNMVLTPILTPALDTHIGGERTTTQLVDIEIRNGSYSFNFEKLGKWVDLCDKVGIKYLEISHFFTQWGAAHAPKVEAVVNGEKKRIFGWDTVATGEEYKAFLRALIPEMLRFLKTKNGADRRCWFHISDEPAECHLENYSKARSIVEELIGDLPIIDTASEYEFFEKGIVTIPIPSNDRVEEFYEKGADPLWMYYCCTQGVGVSNRFIAMPSSRNRVIGMQMYKYGIKGFLHWGYNYYNNQHSYARINPYLRTDGDCFAPSGDAFSVYPGADGEPLESIRLVCFHHALQDMRALSLCETLIGRERTLCLLEQDTDPITFKSCPRTDSWLIGARERINAAIKQSLR